MNVESISGPLGDTALDRPANRSFADRHFFKLILLVWIIALLAMLGLRANAIAMQDFLDVDDQLRLVEVRDWLAGQSFFDVTQYRMNQPWGAPMHWSRLVDMPLAFSIILLRPLIGATNAELTTAVMVPLLTLGVIMLLASLIGRRLSGPGVGIIASVFCAFCLPVLLQTAPLRVDHHGWEIALSMLAVFAALDENGRRSGFIAGIASAVALQISLEALPLALVVGGILAVSWAIEAQLERRRRLAAFSITLLTSEALLLGALHAPSRWTSSYCDAVSAPHIIAIAISAGGVLCLVKLDWKQRMLRILGLGVIGAGAAIAYHAIPPHCGLHAFSELEPNVRELWYNRVLEGLPVWDLPTVLAASTIGFPILGVICAALGWRAASSDRKAAWAIYTILTAAMLIVATLVQRTGGLANALAAPAAAWMLINALNYIRHSRSLLIRIGGSVVAGFALSPLGPVTAVAAVAKPDPDAMERAAAGNKRSCTASEYIKGLSALPQSRILAPLDMGPPILLDTDHAPVASGHHRNHVAMSEVIDAFTGADDVAHRIVNRRGIKFVMMCPLTSEIKVYRTHAPKGFASKLARGNAPKWLEPVTIKGNPIRVWRVIF